MAVPNNIGRPRTSDAEKRKKGTLQKCRQKHPVAAPPAAFVVAAPPTAPEWLGEYGREEWTAKVDLLDRTRTLVKTDLSLLAALCLEWQNYVEAANELVGVPKYYETFNAKTGAVAYMGIHPMHTIAQQHLKSYITLCNEFGFSPASRSRISMPTDEKVVSKAAALLKKAV